MKIEVIKEFLSRYTYFDESKALYAFFSDLPDDLDLDSAKYYLRKEFKEQSAGYDESTFEEPYEEDEGEAWYDSDDEYDDEPEDYWCEFCQEYVSDEYHV